MTTRKISRYTVFILLGITLISFLASCKNKKTEVVDKPATDNIEYPVRIISNFLATSLSDDTPLYPVNEEFLENFIKQSGRFEGEHVRTKTDFPTEWGVVCIEHLPEGRDLWLLQSYNREWMYLVITSGLGTQRILDLIPVAVNLARQDHDVLETENWSTRREADGAFVVDKNYEWIRSVADVSKAEVQQNPSAFQQAWQVTDIYYINDMSRFEYVPKQDTADFRAIIFYYNPENKPEEWDEYIPILQSYTEEKGIIFDEIYSGFNNIRIRDYLGNDIAEVDITPYMGASEAGMVMFSPGEEPKNVSFGSHERMNVEIKRYFKLLHQ